MRRFGIVVGVTLALVALVLAVPDAGLAQQKKIVMWTHWDHSPEFNNWYATKGKEFAKKSGFEVEVVTVPYQGNEAKYLAGFMGKSGDERFAALCLYRDQPAARHADRVRVQPARHPVL